MSTIKLIPGGSLAKFTKKLEGYQWRFAVLTPTKSTELNAATAHPPGDTGNLGRDSTFALAGANSNPIGVIYEPAAVDGARTTVQTLGITKVVCAAQMEAGTHVRSDAQGRAVPATVGQAYVAVLTEYAAGEGSVVQAMLERGMVPENESDPAEDTDQEGPR